MINYYYMGEKVSREEAMYAWRQSMTYKRAAHRDVIWENAETGSDKGGASNHLREAGIRIEIVKEAQEAGNEI